MATTSHEPDRPLRADAERNRQRILDAAAEVFAERGLDVSLDDIAAAACVGVGTVYRRFPSKDDLIDALFEDKIAQVEEVAREADELEDPWEAFEHFIRGACRLHAGDRALKEVLIGGDRGRDRVRAGRERIAPLASRLLSRAQKAGVVRDDLGRYDVPLVQFAIGFVADKTRDVSPDYWERMVTIVLDGLCTRRDAPSPMPAPALGAEEFVAAMSRRSG
jgi:AcrR family transcriptional regulator